MFSNIKNNIDIYNRQIAVLDSWDRKFDTHCRPCRCCIFHNRLCGLGLILGIDCIHKLSSVNANIILNIGNT